MGWNTVFSTVDWQSFRSQKDVWENYGWLGDQLVNCICALYTAGGQQWRRKWFWGLLFNFVRNVPASEMTVVLGDLNGDVGTSADGYEDVYSMYGFRERNVESERVLWCNGNGCGKQCFKTTRISWYRVAYKYSMANLFVKYSLLLNDMFTNVAMMWNCIFLCCDKLQSKC